ncbi:hypothetical protein [Bacillus xiapuensis]|uniref:Uncharacterized protein n=1 Tax=Bacillus xiapuensis TaxID=2014075 RepID=A0ABU6NAS2_9BACI|nr:hypothetical protein [Bacillus xiapuensis]
MRSWIMKKLFYSKMMREIRMRYYREAYNQGQFDQWAEMTEN